MVSEQSFGSLSRFFRNTALSLRRCSAKIPIKEKRRHLSISTFEWSVEPRTVRTGAQEGYGPIKVKISDNAVRFLVYIVNILGRDFE